MVTQILTHRGLEPSKLNFFPESSFEAFQDQLQRGFGIEFDPNFVKDGIVVSHDVSLKRLTENKDERLFEDLTIEELKKITYGQKTKGGIPTFDEVMSLIRNSVSPLNALHFKGKYQTPLNIDRLIAKLLPFKDILARIVIFDVKESTAKKLLESIPNLQLAPSVSHPFDVKRYSQSIANTLIETERAIELIKQGTFGTNPWVWLDEWDLTDENKKTKKLLTESVFDRFRQSGAKISLVTPELHGTSPGLYGGESHPDSSNKDMLMKRINEILLLKPDAICTDYPEEARKLASVIL